MRQQKRRLTKEQEELRLSGLRMLARLIARRCLADLESHSGKGPESGGRMAAGGEDTGLEKAA